MTAALVPPNATKLGLRYEFAIACCKSSGRTVSVSDSSELGPSLSGSSTSSSSHSARSRAIDSCTIGEADRYEVLKGERAIEPDLLWVPLMGRDGVDIVEGEVEIGNFGLRKSRKLPLHIRSNSQLLNMQ